MAYTLRHRGRPIARTSNETGVGKNGEKCRFPPFQSINQSIRKIFNVSRITNVIARSTEIGHDKLQHLRCNISETEGDTT